MRTVAGWVECRSHLYQAARDKFAGGASSPILPTLCTLCTLCAQHQLLCICVLQIPPCAPVHPTYILSYNKWLVQAQPSSSAFTLFLSSLEPYYVQCSSVSCFSESLYFGYFAQLLALLYTDISSSCNPVRLTDLTPAGKTEVAPNDQDTPSCAAAAPRAHGQSFFGAALSFATVSSNRNADNVSSAMSPIFIVQQ